MPEPEPDLGARSPAAEPPGTRCPASPSPGPSSAAATRPSRSTSSAASGGARRASCPRPASRSPLLPGRGIQRKLTLANVGAVRRPRPRPSAQALALVRRRRPSVVVALGRLRLRRLRPGRRALPGPDRGRRAERGARRGQPAGRPLRPRRRPSRSPAPTCPRAVVTGNPVRPEVLAVDRDRDRATAPGHARPARRPGRRGRLRRLAGRPPHQPSRRRRWSSAGPAGPTSPSATSSASGTGTTAPPGARNATGAGGILYRPVRYEDDMPTDAGRRRRGREPGRGDHGRRAGRPRAAQRPRAAAHRHRRPPDGQRPRTWSTSGAARLVPDAELDVDRLEAELGAAGRPIPTALGRMGAGAAPAGPARRRRAGGRPRRGARP